MNANETSRRHSASFVPSSFSFKRRPSNPTLHSPIEADKSSTANTDDNEIRPLRRPSTRARPLPRPTSIRIPPDTSPDIARNWLTATHAPDVVVATPRFTRAGVKSVVMPVKAERPLSIVELPDGFGEAVLIHRYGEGGGEGGVPLEELDIEPERVGPLQHVLSTRSLMWKKQKPPKSCECDDVHVQGQGLDQSQDESQGQGEQQRQGIISVLARGLSLGSVRRLKSRTRSLRRRRTTGEDASVKEARSYGYKPKEDSSVGHTETGSVRREESSSIRHEDNASIQHGENASIPRAATDPGLRRVRRWPWGGLLKLAGRL